MAIADIDPRANTDDQIEPLGETRSFDLGRKEGQVTSIESELDEEQAKLIGRELKNNIDLFAWTVANMLGIHPKVMSHKLALFKEVCSVTQKKRRLGEEKRLTVVLEIQ